MTELHMRYDDLLASLDTIRNLIDDLPNVKANDHRTKVIGTIDDKIERAKRDLKMVDMEVRTVPDPDQRNTWRAKLKNENAKFKQICRDIEWAKSGSDKAPGAGTALPADPARLSEQQFVGYGQGVMRETDEAADSALNIINDTRVVGVDTAAKLKMQTEQLTRVHDQAFEIEDTLGRATFIVKRMLRRTATDKYIWCLSILIVLAIVFIVVWKVYKGDNVKVNTDQYRPK